MKKRLVWKNKMQKLCKKFVEHKDNEIIRLNNKIDAKKLQIVQESTAAIALGCSTASVGIEQHRFSHSMKKQNLSRYIQNGRSWIRSRSR